MYKRQDQSFTDAVIELEIEVEFSQDSTLSQSPELQLPGQLGTDGHSNLVVGENMAVALEISSEFPIGELAFSVNVASGDSVSVLPTIDREGVFSWTPTAAGEFQFDISVLDPNGLSDRISLDFVVMEPAVEEPEPVVEVDDPASEELTSEGGNADEPEGMFDDSEREEFRSLLFRLWSRILRFLDLYER